MLVGLRSAFSARYVTIGFVAVAVHLIAWPAEQASAQELFEFLFGGVRRAPAPPPQALSYAPPAAPVSRMPSTQPSAAAVFVIYDATVAPGHTDMVPVSGPQRSLKGDRLPIRPAEPACSQAAWPHYDINCVRGRTQPNDQPRQIRQVRIVTVDRLPAKHHAAPVAN